jgi:MoaA/NifB/PqqE/SkfB family radical SAM enzyme
MLDRFNPQLKLASDERFSKFLRGEKVYPINIEVSPSHTCNAKCPWCFYAGTHVKKNIGMMDTAVLTKFLNDAANLGVNAITWTGGGEPTLHPDFAAMSELVHALGMKQGLFTNALLKPTYNPSLFEWIRVSNTERAWPTENIQWLRSKTRVLGMAYNYAGNDEEVHTSLRVGKEAKVDYVQIRQALNLRGLVTTRQPPAIQDPLLFITYYKFDDSPNPHGYKQCYGFNFVPFVWYNGNVDVCGYMNKCGSPYTLGNLHHKSFKEIMDEAPRSVPVVGACQVCCKNHLINKTINEALELKDKEFV